MKRVLFTDHQTDIIGGGQRSLLGLMKGLNRQAFSPLLVCSGGGELAAAARGIGVPVAEVNFPSLRGWGLLGAGWTVWWLWRFARREKIDLLHANGSRCMFYAGLVGKLTGIPVVWHLRIAAEDGAWDAFLGRMAACVVAISDAVRQRLIGRVEEERIRVIYNGEDIERFAAADGEEIDRELRGEAEFLIGMVARLTAEKDHETFLRAAVEIVGVRPNVRFLIIGEDPDPEGRRRQNLEELAEELGVREKVVFTGQREDMPELMAGLDLLVHCAHQEGFGRVLVEGMATGTPVVATDEGGIPEVVQGDVTGLLVPPGHPEAVARAVLALLGDSQYLEEMGAAGQQRARALFSLEGHVEKMENLYRDLLEMEEAE